eukprot:6118369-Pyramimonas_sp.AAC.1
MGTEVAARESTSGMSTSSLVDLDGVWGGAIAHGGGGTVGMQQASRGGQGVGGFGMMWDDVDDGLGALAGSTVVQAPVYGRQTTVQQLGSSAGSVSVQGGGIRDAGDSLAEALGLELGDGRDGDSGMGSGSIALDVGSHVTADHDAFDVTVDHAALDVTADHDALDVTADHDALDVTTDHDALDVAADHDALDVTADHDALDVTADHDALDVTADHDALDVIISRQRSRPRKYKWNNSLTPPCGARPKRSNGA